MSTRVLRDQGNSRREATATYQTYGDALRAKAASKKMSRTSCLVLRPTLAEFNDIETLMRRAELESEGAGIVKIVPPAGWWDGASEASRAFDGDTIAGKTSGGRRAKLLLDTLKLRPIRQAVSRPPGTPKGASR